MEKLLKIVLTKYVEEAQKAIYSHKRWAETKTENDYNLWAGHTERRWTLREVLRDYGYTNEELNKIEMEAIKDV